MGVITKTSAAEIAAAEELVSFIQKSPSMFHSVKTIRSYLDEAGFTYLPEAGAWDVRAGGSYYTCRNNSTVIAWKVGERVAEEGSNYHFQLAASHADSPAFKLKNVAEMEGPEAYLRLDTEAYGGMIDYTWFDKPLSLAGRVLVREGSRIESRLVSLDRDVAIIPSLAIHFDRAVNDKFSPNRATDLCPIMSAGDCTVGTVDALVAEHLGIEPENIVARDLFLVNRQRGCVWGAASEFVSSPKLDDLACAFTSLKAFLASDNQRDVSVYCCFDNEEVRTRSRAPCPPCSPIPSRV